MTRNSQVLYIFLHFSWSTFLGKKTQKNPSSSVADLFGGVLGFVGSQMSLYAFCYNFVEESWILYYGFLMLFLIMGLCRLNNMARVNYSYRVPIPKNEGVPKPMKEKKLEGNVRVPKPKKDWRKVVGNVEIHIKEGSKPEIYTEEHEQLLGDCKTTWTLDVDGFDEDGQRIYDQFEGKHCHQCR